MRGIVLSSSSSIGIGGTLREIFTSSIIAKHDRHIHRERTATATVLSPLSRVHATNSALGLSTILSTIVHKSYFLEETIRENCFSSIISLFGSVLDNKSTHIVETME